jgi:hypothetical protein
VRAEPRDERKWSLGQLKFPPAGAFLCPHPNEEPVTPLGNLLDGCGCPLVRCFYQRRGRTPSKQPNLVQPRSDRQLANTGDRRQRRPATRPLGSSSRPLAWSPLLAWQCEGSRCGSCRDRAQGSLRLAASSQPLPCLTARPHSRERARYAAHSHCGRS